MQCNANDSVFMLGQHGGSAILLGEHDGAMVQMLPPQSVDFLETLNHLRTRQ